MRMDPGSNPKVSKNFYINNLQISITIILKIINFITDKTETNIKCAVVGGNMGRTGGHRISLNST